MAQVADPQLVNIKNGIKTILGRVAVPFAIPADNIRLYREGFKNIDAFVDAFTQVAPIGGGRILHAWIMEPHIAVTDPQITIGHFFKVWTFPVTGYISLNNEMENELALERLLESIEDALNQASVELGMPIRELEYEVLQKGNRGFAGIGKKNWVLRVYELSQKVEVEGEGLEELEGELGAGINQPLLSDKDGEVFVRLTQEGVFLNPPFS